jgi:hypothetical protein
MVALGLTLMVLGIIAILSALFVSDGTASVLGVEMNAFSIFLVGVTAGAMLIWGFSILKFGTKREWRQHKERKEIEELSQKLADVNAERSENRE